MLQHVLSQGVRVLPLPRCAVSLRSRLQSQPAASAAECKTCDDRRYLLEAGDTFVRARLCPACTATCTTCGNRGWTYGQDEAGCPVALPCGCQGLRERVALLNQAEIPRRYAQVTIEGLVEHTPSQRQAKVAFLRACADFTPGTRGIGLSGSVGCGKTHLMAGFLKELTLEKGIACRFIEFSHLLSDIRAGYQEGRSDADIIAPLARWPVLVIDELGKGLRTDWQFSILDALISRRYNMDVTTLFTTNYPFVAPPGELRRSREHFQATTLEEQVGERVASRLAQMCTFVRMDGPDQRRQ